MVYQLKPLPKDAFDGGENVRALDYSVLHHAAERFISAMVLSGVFERHRKLRGAAVELGASCTLFLNILDNTIHAFKRTARTSRHVAKALEQITEQMGFTAFPFEDVGMLIEHPIPTFTCSRATTLTSRVAKIHLVPLMPSSRTITK